MVSKGCSLGGNLFGSASAHFTMPLPVKDVDFVKVHAFAQAGSLTTYNTCTSTLWLPLSPQNPYNQN